MFTSLQESNYQFTCKYIELQVFFKIFSDRVSAFKVAHRELKERILYLEEIGNGFKIIVKHLSYMFYIRFVCGVGENICLAGQERAAASYFLPASIMESPSSRSMCPFAITSSL